MHLETSQVLDVHSTRPPDRRKKIPLPFASPPHDLVADLRLTPTDVRVAAALCYWARGKPHCWPSDATIGRRVGRSPGTVQRCLRRLEAAGWIARERTDANRTGRLIRLAWRPGADEAGADAPAPGPPAPRARDEGDVIVKGAPGKEAGRRPGTRRGRGGDADAVERQRPGPTAASSRTPTWTAPVTSAIPT